MHKQHAGKVALSTAGCVFSGVPRHKLQRIRELQAGKWRGGHTRLSVQIRAAAAVTQAA